MRPLEPFASSKHVLIKYSIKNITNVPLGALRVYEAISFSIVYLKSLQMRPSDPFASTRKFPFKPLIKNHYKCPSRATSRL